MARYTTRFQKQTTAKVVITKETRRIVSTIDASLAGQIADLAKKVRDNEQSFEVPFVPTPEVTTSQGLVVFEMWSEVEFSSDFASTVLIDTVTPLELLQGPVDFTDSFFIPISYVAPVLSEMQSTSLRRATIALPASSNIYGIDEAFGINPVAMGDRMQPTAGTPATADNGFHISVWHETNPGVFQQDLGAQFQVPTLSYTLDPLFGPAGTAPFLSSQADGKVKIWAISTNPVFHVTSMIQSFTIELSGVDGSGNALIVPPIIYTKPPGYDIGDIPISTIDNHFFGFTYTNSVGLSEAEFTRPGDPNIYHVSNTGSNLDDAMIEVATNVPLTIGTITGETVFKTPDLRINVGDEQVNGFYKEWDGATLTTYPSVITFDADAIGDVVLDAGATNVIYDASFGTLRLFKWNASGSSWPVTLVISNIVFTGNAHVMPAINLSFGDNPLSVATTNVTETIFVV